MKDLAYTGVYINDVSQLSISGGMEVTAGVSDCTVVLRQNRAVIDLENTWLHTTLTFTVDEGADAPTQAKHVNDTLAALPDSVADIFQLTQLSVGAHSFAISRADVAANALRKLGDHNGHASPFAPEAFGGFGGRPQIRVKEEAKDDDAKTAAAFVANVRQQLVNHYRKNVASIVTANNAAIPIKLDVRINLRELIGHHLVPRFLPQVSGQQPLQAVFKILSTNDFMKVIEGAAAIASLKLSDSYMMVTYTDIKDE